MSLPFPFLSCPPPPPPVARDGTSQDGTDEGGIIGDDGGAGSRCDVTGGDNADDGVHTTAECTKDEDDHPPSPSQSSRHAMPIRAWTG